jgi:ABC-type nitrate/sulfonate/bicarbonate transport system substrate-binding protein
MAADMGGSQYQMVAIYAGAKGLKLGREITIVNGNFAVSRAQLEAGRVEAAVIAEPMATSIMLQNPDWKVIFNGAEGWKELTGQDGWEIVTAMRADAIQRVPAAPKMMIAALQDVAAFIRTETDAADKLANETVKLPAGVLKSAVTGKRWDFDVRPAWGPDRKAIWDMMERAVQAGFYEKMPDEKIIYVP